MVNSRGTKLVSARVKSNRSKVSVVSDSVARLFLKIEFSKMIGVIPFNTHQKKVSQMALNRLENDKSPLANRFDVFSRENNLWLGLVLTPKRTIG